MESYKHVLNNDYTNVAEEKNIYSNDSMDNRQTLDIVTTTFLNVLRNDNADAETIEDAIALMLVRLDLYLKEFSMDERTILKLMKTKVANLSYILDNLNK